MYNEGLPNHQVYSANVIDFVTVAAEICIFLEHAVEEPRNEFINKSLKLLPLLYLKTAVQELPEPAFDDTPEKFVSEEDYLFIKEQIEQLLGPEDTYLEVFHPDMALSDTPIAAFISENLADIYQELKDFAANYQTMDVDIMNDALLACLQAFGEHWGQKVLNSTRALHAIRYSDNFDKEQDEISNTNKINRNAFLNFLQDDDEEEGLETLL
jgi:hypothetical protein